MPAHKKHPTARARRNKTAGAAILTRALTAVPDTTLYVQMTVADLRTEIASRNVDRPADQQMPTRGTKPTLADMLAMDDIAPNRSIPALPDIREGGWHRLTSKWWSDVWTSPLPDQWDTATDFWNVLMIADLLNDWLQGDTPKARREAMGEIRLQRGELGLSPRARLSLEWIFETADEAKAKGERRRTGAAPAGGAAKKTAAKKDPRAGLHAVN